MKSTYYDVLQVSPKASLEFIKAAYAHIKPTLLSASNGGSEEAKNQLLFLEEAYSVLSSPEKRAAYDAKISGDEVPQTSVPSFSYAADDAFEPKWRDTTLGRVMIAVIFFAIVFSVYKFMGQRGEQKLQNKQLEIQSQRDIGSVQNDSYHAETERSLVNGAVQNQDKLIDRSFDIASREAERRQAELEHRATLSAQQQEMQRQRQEAMLQEQRWRQEQYEKDRQAREARAAADAPKKQLCNMYALNGNTRDAQAAGCYRY